MESPRHGSGVGGSRSPPQRPANDGSLPPEEAEDGTLSQESTLAGEEATQQEVEPGHLEDETMLTHSEDEGEHSSPACSSTYSSPRKRVFIPDNEPPPPPKRHRTLLPNPHPFRESLPPSWSGMEDFVDVAPGTWVLRCGSDDWKIVVDYSTHGTELIAESGVMDLTWFLPGKGPGTTDERNAAYKQFLHQFETVNSRWMNMYETVTNDIIAAAARFQTSLLQRMGAGSSIREAREDEGDMLVLSSLRCLALSQDLSHISMSLPYKATLPEVLPPDDDYLILEESELVRSINPDYKDRKSLNPAVELFRLPRPGDDGPARRPAPTSSKKPADTFPYLVRRTLWTAERLVAGGRPRDWPTVFYAMAVLMLAEMAFWYMADVTTCLEKPRRQFRRRLVHLMGVFLERCGDWHPLNDGVDLEEFARIVGHDPLLVDQYTLMNEMWCEGISWFDDVAEDAESFFDCLDLFVSGFAARPPDYSRPATESDNIERT